MGELATHIDDIWGCGECDLLSKVRGFSEKRSGGMKVQEGSFVHVGMELAQEKNFSATLTQADFTQNVKFIPTPPELWAGRKEPLSMERIKLRYCKLRELRWVSAVPSPDICARWARIA